MIDQQNIDWYDTNIQCTVNNYFKQYYVMINAITDVESYIILI